MSESAESRVAWVLTGSGHYLRECMEIVKGLDGVDLFLSEAAGEVLKMYGYDVAKLRDGMKVFRDNTASSVPVTFLYGGDYHTVVIGPASSNTVAKCVAGISDTLATNIYAQAGKCRIPSIVFACDTAPALISEAPGGDVWVYPRAVDLENVARLAKFDHTTVVLSVEELAIALDQRLSCPSTSSS
ncbi:MAG TPA: flavoprotein [Burkholderiales bacterium]|nr:flavoprotein [Burkholderiales bacterium]